MDICTLYEEVKNNEKLKTFYSFLIEENKKYNLTSITDENEALIKHFLDSAMGKDLFAPNATVVEVGSGGGFPSMPLKILRDDLAFTLIESTGKKCEFLRRASELLQLTPVNVLNVRAEDAGRDDSLREKFDHCTARAVARLNTLCEYCLPLVKVGGSFIAYKGDAEDEIKEAANAVKVLGGKIENVICYDLPQDMGKRTIIVIKKIKSTPAAYPRGNGKERKKPL